MIEDELHMLCQCPKYQLLRDQMYQHDQVLSDKNIKANRDYKEVFNDILSSTDSDVLKATGMFIFMCDVT